MSAILSKDGLYRYRLGRIIDVEKKSTMMFVMLNPSIANAEMDDPTIRRCIGFAKREGMGKLEVVNLYAFRATQPADLFRAKEPVGEDNLKHIEQCANSADIIVAGWGTHGKDRIVVDAVCDVFKKIGKQVFCLGKTKEGYPKHPLYIRTDQKLILF